MTTSDLKQRLDNEGVNPYAYSFDIGNIGECWVLLRDGSRWTTYYAERGHNIDQQWFDSEDEACRYLLQTLLADPTTRLGPRRQ